MHGFVVLPWLFSWHMALPKIELPRVSPVMPRHPAGVTIENALPTLEYLKEIHDIYNLCNILKGNSCYIYTYIFLIPITFI